MSSEKKELLKIEILSVIGLKQMEKELISIQE